MKIDSHGKIIWEKSIEAPQGTKVRKNNEGYAICSSVWTWTGDHQEFCLIITDGEGNSLSFKLYCGDNSDHLYDFDLTSDDGFIFAGHTLSYGVENWDYLLMKIDSDGNEEWHRTFGQPRGYDPKYIHDESYGVRQTPDGGFIVFVDTDLQSYPAPNNYGFMKIAADQFTNIEDIYLSKSIRLNLNQNYPNPFNPTTIINYSIANGENVKIGIYNILGVEITQLVDEYKNIGDYSIKFNGNNLPSG